ncbi:unnamed protein product, partial [Cuscuta europaea]
MIGVEQV